MEQRISIVTLGVADLKRSHPTRLEDEAEAAGARLLKPAQEAFWGGYSGYFSDPDGFLCEVAGNPSFRLA